jgi:uncharacterized phage-associated protein
MMSFELDIDKAIEASLFILNAQKSCDLHKLFKLLYFADRKHLSQYGRPITGDRYMAMKHGPVPSFVYDALKLVRGDNSYLKIDRNPSDYFSVVNRIYVGGKREANLEYLSQSDIDCLEETINEYKDLSFSERTRLSHDEAWTRVDENDNMDVLAIAAAGGADTEMLRYIAGNIAHSKAFACR